MSSNYWDQILIGLSLISIHNDVSLNLIYTVTTESAGWAWLQSDLLNTTISDELLFSWMYLQTDDADAMHTFNIDSCQWLKFLSYTT